ncbi:MAG: hypothetical protein ABIH86_06885 [Planctomycetota bacterium]
MLASSASLTGSERLSLFVKPGRTYYIRVLTIDGYPNLSYRMTVSPIVRSIKYKSNLCSGTAIRSLPGTSGWTMLVLTAVAFGAFLLRRQSRSV